jgi:hypothetical protein
VRAFGWYTQYMLKGMQRFMKEQNH